jgi:hypothetical protein
MAHIQTTIENVKKGVEKMKQQPQVEKVSSSGENGFFSAGFIVRGFEGGLTFDQMSGILSVWFHKKFWFDDEAFAEKVIRDFFL